MPLRVRQPEWVKRAKEKIRMTFFNGGPRRDIAWKYGVNSAQSELVIKGSYFSQYEETMALFCYRPKDEYEVGLFKSYAAGNGGFHMFNILELPRNKVIKG